MQRGGRPARAEIELITYDPQSNIQLYTQFATQAATKDRVAVVHGGITSASREAIRPHPETVQHAVFLQHTV